MKIHIPYWRPYITFPLSMDIPPIRAMTLEEVWNNPHLEEKTIDSPIRKAISGNYYVKDPQGCWIEVIIGKEKEMSEETNMARQVIDEPNQHPSATVFFSTLYACKFLAVNGTGWSWRIDVKEIEHSDDIGKFNRIVYSEGRQGMMIRYLAVKSFEYDINSQVMTIILREGE